MDNNDINNTIEDILHKKETDEYFNAVSEIIENKELPLEEMKTRLKEVQSKYRRCGFYYKRKE